MNLVLNGLSFQVSVTQPHRNRINWPWGALAQREGKMCELGGGAHERTRGRLQWRRGQGARRGCPEPHPHPPETSGSRHGEQSHGHAGATGLTGLTGVFPLQPWVGGWAEAG